MLDFNRAVTSSLVSNDAINAQIDAAITAKISNQEKREYLGASSLGHDCLRKIAWDWRHRTTHEPRTERIFARGHWVETYTVALMVQAGFRFERNGPSVAFSQLGGRFRGHGDGKITAGPEIAGISYPCLWEHKGLGSKGWTKLVKDGLVKAYPGYADQVALYQGYFDLTDHPAIFTACNMDTMELVHLSVPFDPVRAQAASDRAVTIVRADAVNETLPRVTDNPEDWRCRMCGHRERCWG